MGDISAAGLSVHVVTIPLIPKTWFDLRGEASQIQEIIIADRLNTSRFLYGRLCVRYHERKSFATNAQLRFFFRWMLNSDVDPERDFIDNTVRGDTQVITAVAADNPNPVDTNFNPVNGIIRLSNMWSEVAPMTRVIMELNQGAAGADMRTWVAVSVDMQLRVF